MPTKICHGANKNMTLICHTSKNLQLISNTNQNLQLISNTNQNLQLISNPNQKPYESYPRFKNINQNSPTIRNSTPFPKSVSILHHLTQKEVACWITLLPIPKQRVTVRTIDVCFVSNLTESIASTFFSIGLEPTGVLLVLKQVNLNNKQVYDNITMFVSMIPTSSCNSHLSNQT